MKESEVPQDTSSLGENSLKELCYAVNEKGEYVTALSAGWEPKTIVQQATLDAISVRIEEAKQQVEQGIVSPIVYYMELQRMDLTTLAAYVKLWKWRVKRHFNPTTFNKLNSSILERYATVFNITVEELKTFGKK